MSPYRRAKKTASQQKKQIKSNKSKAYYVLLLLQNASVIHDIRMFCSTQKQSNKTVQTTSRAYMSSSSQYCAAKGHIMRLHLPREKEQLFVIMCSACILKICPEKTMANGLEPLFHGFIRHIYLLFRHL